MAKSGKEKSAKDSEDLYQRVLQESLVIISQEGVYALSLRKVARKLGVSHAAPYRHFPTKEHILAALTILAFDTFTEYLATGLTPLYQIEMLEARFIRMGENYFKFAFDEPEFYQFMFGPSHFDHADFPEVKAHADKSFQLLSEQIAAMQHSKLIPGKNPLPQSMFVFSAMHGFASLALNGATENLVEDQQTRQQLKVFIRDTVLNAIRFAPKL